MHEEMESVVLRDFGQGQQIRLRALAMCSASIHSIEKVKFAFFFLKFAVQCFHFFMRKREVADECACVMWPMNINEFYLHIYFDFNSFFLPLSTFK